MACATGGSHTITLSDDGIAYAIGYNAGGQLGLGHNNDAVFPTEIPNLPKIKQVSCGEWFTVCIDEEGCGWSFGYNNYGQLGTGDRVQYNLPQKIIEIPPIYSVSCGAIHTLMITNDKNLWSVGRNEYGQLCLQDTMHHDTPQQTTFSNISKISAGYYHSLFQNDKGEIYACGKNEYGALDLGNNKKSNIKRAQIPNLPPNIIQFMCGYLHSLFLDIEGNVFSVGFNSYGNLGLGHLKHINLLNKIPNIPPIQSISCSSHSSYLIDYDGNVWSFGMNYSNQLGYERSFFQKLMNKPRISSVPKKIPSLSNITQISSGCCSTFFLAKDSQNRIFGTGGNELGQLGIGIDQQNAIAIELSSNYSEIWGDVKNGEPCRAKSARK